MLMGRERHEETEASVMQIGNLLIKMCCFKPL